MNKRVQAILSFVRSETATIWFLGFFIIYYLAKTVWSTEAFASLMENLSSSNLFRSAYVLLVLNITSRVSFAAWRLRRRKVLFFLRMPLYAGLILFLIFFFLGLNVRESNLALVSKGDPVEIPWEHEVYRVVSVDSALERHALRGDESLIFDYEPRITLIDGSGVHYNIGAFPPQRINSGYLHILNFGIAPGVELRQNGEVLYSGHIPMSLTPFGTIDSFEVKQLPYKFYMNILPTRTIKKGRETAREYDLSNPRYGVEVTRGDALIAKGQTDRTISFDGPVSLSFISPIDWVLLQSVYDPFLKPLLAGVVLLLMGAILYPFSILVSKDDAQLTERGTF
jgi:hypothetical protein